MQREESANPVRLSMATRARLLVVVAVLVGMPLAALPPARDWIAAAFRGPSQPAGNSRFGAESPPLVAVAQSVRPVVADERPRVVASHRSDASRGGRIVESFRVAQQELAEMGAALVRLEGPSADEAAFRFVCEFPIGHSVYRRTFQARHAEPNVAIGRVVADVRAWRAASSALARSALRGGANLP